MLLIIIAAIFSVSVSVALKLYKSRRFDILQILMFNYVTASLAAYFWFKPDFSQLNEQTPWWLIIVLGVLLPSIFWCLDRSLHHAGLIKTEIAQRISVVMTILISAVIYQEQFTALKVLGIVLGILAVMLMLLGKSNQPIQGQKPYLMWLSLLAVWLGYAVIDLLLKYLSTFGMQFATSLNLMFYAALICVLLVAILNKTKWHWQSMCAGAVLGMLNFLNIVFYLQAHKVLKDTPATVFAGMNILVVVFGVMAAVVIFKEKLNVQKTLGGGLAIAAVYCLMQSML